MAVPTGGCEHRTAPGIPSPLTTQVPPGRDMSCPLIPQEQGKECSGRQRALAVSMRDHQKPHNRLGRACPGPTCAVRPWVTAAGRCQGKGGRGGWPGSQVPGAERHLPPAPLVTGPRAPVTTEHAACWPWGPVPPAPAGQGWGRRRGRADGPPAPPPVRPGLPRVAGGRPPAGPWVRGGHVHGGVAASVPRGLRPSPAVRGPGRPRHSPRPHPPAPHGRVCRRAPRA